jgi:hypothetical protein
VVCPSPEEMMGTGSILHIQVSARRHTTSPCTGSRHPQLRATAGCTEKKTFIARFSLRREKFGQDTRKESRPKAQGQRKRKTTEIMAPHPGDESPKGWRWTPLISWLFTILVHAGRLYSFRDPWASKKKGPSIIYIETTILETLGQATRKGPALYIKTKPVGVRPPHDFH